MAEIDKLLDMYEIDYGQLNPVLEFVSNSVEARRVLLAAPKKIAKYFDKPKLKLELFGFEEVGFLQISIVVSPDDLSSLDRMLRMESEWWMAERAGCQSLCIELVREEDSESR